MITRFAETIGMILMIAPARVINGAPLNLTEPLSEWARSAKSTYTVVGRFDTTASVKASATGQQLQLVSRYQHRWYPARL